MPFAAGTLVTYHLEDGKTFIGKVKSFENGKYTIVQGETEVKVDEDKVHEFATHLMTPGIMDVLGSILN